MSESKQTCRLDAGVTLIDVADGLDWGGCAFGKSEALLGKGLADAPDIRSRMIGALR